MRKSMAVSMTRVAFLLLTLLAGPGYGSGSQDEAKALVDKAAAFLKSSGPEKGLEEFNQPKSPFVKGEYYVFVYDLTGTMVAHPVNAKLVGKNLMDVPDVEGKLFRKDIVEMAKAKGTGWVDYRYKNPQTGKIESKTTYLQKVGDMILCCGAYK